MIVFAAIVVIGLFLLTAGWIMADSDNKNFFDACISAAGIWAALYFVGWLFSH